VKYIDREKHCMLPDDMTFEKDIYTFNLIHDIRELEKYFNYLKGIKTSVFMILGWRNEKREKVMNDNYLEILN
jgi:hypothetical protein